MRLPVQNANTGRAQRPISRLAGLGLVRVRIWLVVDASWNQTTRRSRPRYPNPQWNADCGIIWNQNTIDAEEEYTELFIWFRLSEKSHGSVWPNLIDQYLAEPAFWLQKSLGCQQFLGQRPTRRNKRAGPCQVSPANIWSKIKGNNWAKLGWTAVRNISKHFNPIQGTA